MALDLYLPFKNPPTGTTGTAVKPITEGERVNVVQDQSTGGFWSILDDVGTTAVNGVKDILGAVAQKEVNNLKGSGVSTTDSTGNPADQAGGGVPGDAASAKPFYQQYATELKIGGAAVAGLVLIYALTR